MVVRRTPEELKQALNEQREALSDSCKAFDDGKKWEAKRIAVAVYVIVHDGGKHNKSILTQLGLKDRIKFVASGRYIDGKNLLRDTPLAGIEIRGDGTAGYIPHCAMQLASADRLISFLQWWERDLIFKDGYFTITRKKLAYNLRSIEGGAHYDAMVQDPNYLRFSQEQITTPRVGFADHEKIILGAELASMRQIGWELLQTLEPIVR